MTSFAKYIKTNILLLYFFKHRTMPTQKDGETYYALDEVSKKLDESIKIEAKNLLKRLQDKKKIEHKEKMYV